ncbi:MAG: DUF2809 domain-containing protein [Myxococcales bacterium]|nr:MAG: DUF2809 domain-containing protein [Myxococcales bacterium]
MSLRRRRLALIVAVTLLGAAVVLLYRGPLWRPLRAHGGDLLVPPFLFAALGLVTPWSRRTRVALTAALTVGTELVQALALPLPPGLLIDLLLGRTFDPLDLLAYAVGLLAAVALERRWVDGKKILSG